MMYTSNTMASYSNRAHPNQKHCSNKICSWTFVVQAIYIQNSGKIEQLTTAYLVSLDLELALI